MHSITGKKFTLLAVTVILLSLMLAAPVFAEGEAPAEEPAPAGEIPPDEETTPLAEEPPADSTPTEEVPPEETPLLETELPTEEAPPEDGGETPAEETPPVEEPAVEGESLPEALAEADLSLATAEGETLDMASEQGAGALAAPDPYFMVGTTTYRFFEAAGVCAASYPGDPNCYDNQGADVIQDAINHIQTKGTIPSDRKIYVEGDTYTSNVTFDGSLPNISTLNGLIGVDGSASTTINGDVDFYSLTNGFTLQGFTINGQVTGFNMSGTITLEDVKVENASGNGIYIHANADSAVVMTDVTSSNNSGWGAVIDNDDSGLPYNVTIKNSYFDDNGSGGNTNSLSIKSLGKIIIDGISSSRNQGAGILIYSDFSSLSIKNAVMVNNDANPDVSDMGYGLKIHTTQVANVTLENLYVIDAHENNPAVDITTGGSVTVRNATVIQSAYVGMEIDNFHGTGFVKIYNSQFNYNGSHGLDIQSRGTVYLSSVSAHDNGGIGAKIDNCWDTGSGCAGIGTVTITSPKSAGVYGVNNFSNNGYEGLWVASNKAISLTNIIADDNGYEGIQLYNATGSGGITLKKNLPSSQYFTFYNSASGNGYDGFDAQSNGAIRVEYLLANGNTYHGAFLDNDSSGSSPGINILHSEFNENDWTGLWAYSKGSIALTNVSASKNNAGPSYHGAQLYTMVGTSGGVSIKGINGYVCQFNENGSRGFYIYARGNVTLSNIEANDNVQPTYIDNWDTTYAKKVTIKNATFNNQTTGYGLEVYSKGTISLNKVEANNNGRGGAFLNNTYGLGSVIVKYSEFNENSIGTGWNALDIRTNRNITLYAVSASDNDALGARAICDGKGTVSIKSGKGVYNTFNNNGDIGLYIWANGTITLSNIVASNNGSYGLWISNSDSGFTGNVSISAGRKMRNTIEKNASTGLYIVSNGTVSLKYIDCFNNKGIGADIDNSSAVTAKGVTIKESTFIMNQGRGLEVYSLGTITLQGVDCSDNSIFNGTINILGGGWREVLSHTRGNDVWTFTASGTDDDYVINLKSAFFDAYLELYAPDGQLLASDDNGGTGTDAFLSGIDLPDGVYTIVVRSADGTGGGSYDLTLNTTSLSTFSWYGAYLDNSGGTGNVKILHSSRVGYGFKAWNNSYTGLRIASNGAVSLSQVESMYNGGNGGVYITNGDAAEKPVSIKTATAEGNYSNGFYISSWGNVTLNKVYSYENGGSGAYINNSNAAVNRYVKVTSSEFIDNRGLYGLFIESKGNITLGSVVSENPDANYGAYIDNTDGTGNVTVSGKNNVFDNHDLYGLYIISHGHISLANFTASDNTSDGVYARNGYTGFDPVNIKITNTQKKSFNYINDNGSEGLYLLSFGTITVNKVHADNNPTNSYIDNASAPEFKKVTVTNSIFSSTTGDGLYISAYGPVLLNNVRLLDNTGDGVYIHNSTAAEQDVFIKNTTASGNTGYGASITSAGFVNINKLNANGNTLSGILVQNGAGDEGITITKSNFYNNQQRGMLVYTDGPVSLNTVTARGNTLNGIFIDGGISDIAVNLYKVNAIFNLDDGIVLDGVSSVTVNFTNSIGNGTAANDDDGLHISGNGSTIVTLNMSVFMGNYGNGVDLSNTATPTITSTLIFGNDIDGEGEDNLYVH